MTYSTIIVITILCAVIIGYLFGSIVSGDIVKRFYKIDPRQHFSHNPGTTNSIRTFGVVGGSIVLLGDILKVVVATVIVWEIYHVLNYQNEVIKTNDSCWVIYLTGLFSNIGHAFPIFFKFKGGKCVATFFGGLVVISPWIAIIGMTSFIIIALSSKYISLASIMASLLSVILLFVPWLDFFYLLKSWLIPENKTLIWYATYNNNLATIIATGVIFLLSWTIVCLRHRQNIYRLIHQTENKISDLRKDKTMNKS